ncbi:hypothetical protein [Rugosimonospora acidiphila]|uniref:hypothetical protein n=1 Tax=Rugosimonospora acidiphila TaxID=556531 RepID=UPI0031EC39D6
MKPSAETMEMRRLVGKFALLLAFVYILVLVGGVVTLAGRTSVPVITWPLILIPGAAFVPAAIDAVRLHRTTDSYRTTALWRRCALYTAIGLVLLIADAIALNQVNS